MTVRRGRVTYKGKVGLQRGLPRMGMSWEALALKEQTGGTVTHTLATFGV